MLLLSLKRIVLWEDIMRPSNYNYLKRMWTRSYCNRKRGIISYILLFPFKLIILISASVIMVGFYILFYGVLFLLKAIWEFSKLFFQFLKDLIVGLYHIVKHQSNNESIVVNENSNSVLYNVGRLIIQSNEVHIPTIQRTYKLSYFTVIELLDKLKDMGVVYKDDIDDKYENVHIVMDIDSFEKMFNR